MFKFLVLLFGSFWLSCGNSPRTAPNITPESEKENERVPFDLTENTLSDELQKEVASISEKEKSIVDETDNTDKKTVVLPNHAQWNALLAKYVNDKGDVDYKGFQSDSTLLGNYLNYLSENSPEKAWSKHEKLAYYINLYNAATIKLISDNYPIESIKDIKNPWGKDWVKTGDGKLSLGDIEHKILRKMKEPRIHFAINCASFSCPKLLNVAFNADQLEAQLQRVTSDFINDTTRNIISEKKMHLSKIFKWYKNDFTENGSLVDYIKSYNEIDINDHTTIDFLKYDWNLNEAK